MPEDKCSWKHCRMDGNSVSIVGLKTKRTYDLCPKHYVELCHSSDELEMRMTELIERMGKPRPEKKG